MKHNPMWRLLSPVGIALFATAVVATDAAAIGDCVPGYAAEVVEFVQGPAANPAGAVDGAHSDPSKLLGGSAGAAHLTLGIGGTLTLKFVPPVVNYPVVGGLVLESPVGSPSCADRPERAEVSVSQDGIHYVVLGTACLGATFDLGALPWATFVKIRDITDPSDPAFAGASTDGYDLRTVTGPACLKRLACPLAAAPDVTFSTVTETRAFALPTLGTDFILSNDVTFEEYSNGTARFQGTVFRASDPSLAYFAIISFTGRITTVPVGSPKLELDPSAYVAGGGPIDPASWFYYKTWSGTLFGFGATAGQDIAISRIDALQVGTGANGRNLKFGASGGFLYTEMGAPAEEGKLTVDLGVCPGTPTPTPIPVTTPTATPTSSATATAVPTGSATSIPTSTPTPPDSRVDIPTPTAVPTSSTTPAATPTSVTTGVPDKSTPTPTSTPVENTNPSCLERDIEPLLVTLDGALLDRRALIQRATKLLVRVAPTEANRALRKSAVAAALNFYTSGWENIWSIPQTIKSCDPSPLCVTVSFEPSRSSVASSAAELDKLVTTVLTKTAKAVAGRRPSVSAVKRLRVEHASQLAAFEKDLAGVPASTTSCG